LIRNSLELCGWKDRKALAVAYAPSARRPRPKRQAAPWTLYCRPLKHRFPAIVKAWRSTLTHVILLFAFPPRCAVIYTTNALESAHARVRKIIKTRGHFRSDEAAATLIWLALRNITGPRRLITGKPP
jgi:transposase-like protein